METAEPETEKQKKIQGGGDRKRSETFYTLVIISLLIIPVNIYLAILRSNLAEVSPELIWNTSHPFDLAQIFFPFAMGIGLLFFRSVGWWIYQTGALYIIIYNSIEVSIFPTIYNVYAVVEIVIHLYTFSYLIQPGFARN